MRELAIGIDLGTTYSAVSVIDENGSPHLLRNSDGEFLTPSVIAFEEDGTYMVGSDAKKRMQDGDDNVACFFKRLMGDSTWSFNAFGKTYSATDLSSLLLEKLRKDAEESLGREIHQAVITVPAYFDEPRLSATKCAAERAGLTVLRLLREPTAAAIYYGITRNVDQRLLVYDLGGGTFDVTVLMVENNEFKVRATGGDHQLGGKDWDDAIFDYLQNQFQQEFGIDLKDDPFTWNELRVKAEKVKRQLSTLPFVYVKVKSDGCEGKYLVTQELFERLTAHLMQRTISTTDRVLGEANMKWDDVTGVLLVGGSTLMPMVKNWIRSQTKKEPLGGVNVVEAVCLGAGLVAGLLKSKEEIMVLGGRTNEDSNRFVLPNGKSVEIQDVMAHSLGAVSENQEGDRYVNTIIIRRNQSIPAVESKEFNKTIYKSVANTMDVYLTQGEAREITDSDFKIVRRYVISGYDQKNKGGFEGQQNNQTTVVVVKYGYDINGMIKVEAMQKETQLPLRVEEAPIPEDLSFLYEGPKKKEKIPVNIMMAIDVSGSMMSNNRIGHARNAALRFINEIDLSTMSVCIVVFHNQCKMLCDMTNDGTRLQKVIKRIVAENRGTGANPVFWGYQKFINHREEKALLLILTDGEWFHQQDAILYSDSCRREGIDIIGVGIGNANEAFLKRISTIATLSDLENLEDVYGTIAREINEHRGANGIILK